MKHHWLSWEELSSQFPKDGEFKDGMRPKQKEAFEFIAENGSATIEMPTGEGKTAIEVTIARVAKRHFKKCFVVTSRKTIVDQIVQRFPDDFVVVLGRNSYPCYFYEKEKETLETPDRKYKYKADEVPTSLCHTCPHYVSPETGETNEKGAAPCQYYKAKHAALNSRKPVLATMSFYLFSRLFSKGFDEPDVLVIDEAHNVPETVRAALSYDITDWHLERAIEILEKVEEHEAAAGLETFRKRMIKVVKKKPAKRGTLLNASEITEFIGILEEIDVDAVRRSVAKAIRDDTLDVEDNIEVLRKVENVVYNLRRYVRSLKYSLPLADRGALAYTYAYHVKEKGERERVMNKLVVCSHYIAPLVTQCLLGKTTIALSATIGDKGIFGEESGIISKFLSLPPTFPPENTRIFMPTDTPDLSFNNRKRGAVTNVMRRMARHTKWLSKRGKRSLHIVVSNEELQKLCSIMADEGVKAISYGNGITAREAAIRFKDGEGDCLVGTSSHFGEGIDLPRQIAPFIFALRPGYPPPTDPRTQFEELRYGNQRWAIWNWRVMLAIMQWRGRNIRNEDDLGSTIFISQQYRRVVFASLPATLQISYRGNLTLDQCVKEGDRLAA